MFQSLYPKGKTAQYLLKRRLVGLHSQSGCFEAEKTPAYTRNGTQDYPFCSIVT
jgi:hypothetical protein